MRWPGFWGSSPQGDDNDKNDNDPGKKPSLAAQVKSSLSNLDPDESTRSSYSSTTTDDLLTTLTTPATYADPSVLVPTVLLTTLLLTGISFSRRYLKRIPNASYIPPSFYRKRSLFGYVTSVGDADNFRLYHTPGGRLAGWGWLRRLPPSLSATAAKTEGKQQQQQQIKPPKSSETIHIRLAGVDAPELAHFGQPAQPHGAESLTFLRTLLSYRRVRVFLWRPDQYGRAVATAYIRRPRYYLGLVREDVGLAMLKSGMATVYEAKSGAEFGGEEKERGYRRAEEKARVGRKGLWSLEGSEGFESPRQFKDRGREEAKMAAVAAAGASGSASAATQGLVSKAVRNVRSLLMFWK